MSIPFISYRLLIDPLLKPVRTAMISLIPPESSLIDVACGTGDFLMQLAPVCSSLCGIDQNLNVMRKAGRRLKIGIHDHICFRAADGRDMPFMGEGEYEYATITLALHEMPAENRLPILKEMKRIAHHLILADYASPLPHNGPGRITKVIERLAGRDHFAGFSSYQKNGGLDPLLKSAGLEVVNESTLLGGVIRLINCRKSLLSRTE